MQSENKKVSDRFYSRLFSRCRALLCLARGHIEKFCHERVNLDCCKQIEITEAQSELYSV